MLVQTHGSWICLDARLAERIFFNHPPFPHASIFTVRPQFAFNGLEILFVGSPEKRLDLYNLLHFDTFFSSVVQFSPIAIQRRKQQRERKPKTSPAKKHNVH